MQNSLFFSCQSKYLRSGLVQWKKEKMAEQENVSLLDLPRASVDGKGSPSETSKQKGYVVDDMNIVDDVMDYVSGKQQRRSMITPEHHQTNKSSSTFGDWIAKLSKYDAVHYGIAGVISGLCTATATQPLDCVKTRIQVFRRLNMNLPTTPSSTELPRNIFQRIHQSRTFTMLSSIYSTEGFRALYR